MHASGAFLGAIECGEIAGRMEVEQEECTEEPEERAN